MPDPAGPATPASAGRRRPYRTGRSDLDAAIEHLVATADLPDHQDLVTELVVSALRLGHDSDDRSELKMVNTALKELRYAFGVFAPYADVPKVSIFGSARIRPDDPVYAMAVELAGAISSQGWMVITGAGPGIMTAGVEGAGVDRAFGVNIVLPFEAEPTPLLADDPKLINFRYFFTRKVTFMRESRGFVLLPGGFGTMDEAFELLTLLQTGRTHPAPVVLLDEPEGSYWDAWLDFTRRHLLGRGLISDDDLCLVRVCSSVDAAVEEICTFYDTYHSMRFVGDRLVLRLQRQVGDDELVDINDRFGALLTSGRIEPMAATEQEVADDDVVDLPRLGLRFDRASWAALRRLIDRLNEVGLDRPTSDAPGPAPYLDAIRQAEELGAVVPDDGP